MKKIILKNGTVMISTELVDCYIIEPKVHGDHRGYFMETHNETALKEVGFNYKFVQGNESFTKEKYTIRGLHFQTEPYTQAKLVRCTQGIVDDVVVDLRIGSPSYKKWIRVELSKENKRQLLIPRGFAHGFITKTEDVVFNYVVDNDYSYPNDAGILWNDSEIGVDWGIPKDIQPILSDKDTKHPVLSLSRANFKF